MKQSEEVHLAIGPNSSNNHVVSLIFSTAVQFIVIYCHILNGNQMAPLRDLPTVIHLRQNNLQLDLKNVVSNDDQMIINLQYQTYVKHMYYLSTPIMDQR
jgi:hypothetical protein